MDSNFGGNVYIYNYILSVIVVKVLSDSETSPRTQTAVSALFGDRLTASIQVVTTTITTIPTVGVYASGDKKTIATFPAYQDDLLKC